MKKVLLLLVAVVGLTMMSCTSNEGTKPAAADGEKPAAEKVEEKVDINELVAKAKAEGANWSVDEWKAAFKSMLIGVKPMLDFMKDMKEKMEKGSEADKIKMLGELEAKAKEMEPFEKAMDEFNNAAQATENGKKVADDEEWGMQVLKELGYPEDVFK